MSDYIEEKLERAQKTVKNLTAVQKYTAPGGKLQEVKNNVFDYVRCLRVWKQDELEVALGECDLLPCIENMLALFNDELMHGLTDTDPNYIACIALRETILQAAPLTSDVAAKLVEANIRYCKREDKRTSELMCRCRRRCHCNDDEQTEDSVNDESSGDDTVLGDALDSLPLVQELVAEFGGNWQRDQRRAKSAKTDDE
jgi:hypothetical protein